MKDIIFYLVFFVTCLTACGKKIDIDDVFKSDLKITNSIIDADGTSTDTLSVVLNSNASSDRRNVIFSASSGTLINGQNGKITVAADYLNGQLLAVAVLKAPLSPGVITITAMPATTSPNSDYVKTNTITANLVLPATISLVPSSFGIGANFSNTDTIVGTLRGIAHQKVSQGANVFFEDSIGNGFSTHGNFRNQNTTSDNNSQVTTLYNAPFMVTIGTKIYIKAIILNNTRANSPDSSLVVLSVNQ